MSSFHLCALSRRETRLFENHHEAAMLWSVVVRTIRAPNALCLMPDHVHVHHARDVRAELAAAMRGYAKWRRRARGEPGPVWYPLEPTESVGDRAHFRRTVRYVHLNPCRKKPLVGDPLAWPWSTHRDAVGLSLVPVVRRRSDASSFHGYVSRDSEVSLEGTLLPGGGLVVTGLAGLRSLAAAYCAVGRFERAALERKGRVRADFVRLLAACSEVPAVRIAEFVGVDASTVRHAGRRMRPWMRRVLRVVDDPRFDHQEQLDRAIGGYRPWSRRKDVD